MQDQAIRAGRILQIHRDGHRFELSPDVDDCMFACIDHQGVGMSVRLNPADRALIKQWMEESFEDKSMTNASKSSPHHPAYQCPFCQLNTAGEHETKCPNHPLSNPQIKWIPNSPVGWVCPLCGRSNSPSTSACPCYVDRHPIKVSDVVPLVESTSPKD